MQQKLRRNTAAQLDREERVTMKFTLHCRHNMRWRILSSGIQRSVVCESKPTFQRNIFTLISFCMYSSTLTFEEYVPPKRGFTFNGIKRHYIPEDNTLDNHRCENFKPYISRVVCRFYHTTCRIAQRCIIFHFLKYSPYWKILCSTIFISWWVNF
jgi:hypothetical protein